MGVRRTHEAIPHDDLHCVWKAGLLARLKGALSPQAAGLPFLATGRNEQVRVTPPGNRLYEPAHTAAGFLDRPLFAGSGRNGGCLPGASNAANASAKIYSEIAGIRSEGEPDHIRTGLGGVG